MAIFVILTVLLLFFFPCHTAAGIGILTVIYAAVLLAAQIWEWYRYRKRHPGADREAFRQYKRRGEKTQQR